MEVNPVTPVESAPDTEMDEFETSSKTQKATPVKNVMKITKVGLIAVVSLFIIGAAVYGISMMSGAKKQAQVRATPKSTATATVMPSATPEVVYPEEFAIVQEKIDRYAQEVTTPQEERNKLNVPPMDTRATF